jgi:class I fructose-bisphosphate aldolase
MPATDRVKQILSWYGSDNPGVKTNLARMLMHGRLAGTGKMVILPVDQGFEHGPARSFAPNPDGYDPDYHFQLGQVPLILKLNNSDTLAKVDQPCSAVTGSVRDAQRLGCAAIGYTIYPGSGARNVQYEALRELILQGKEAGIPTVVWSYPRGAGLSKEGETAIDVTAYAVQIAAQLGAHVIKVKPPKAHIEQAEAKKTFEKQNIPIATLAERVKHCVQSAFAGKRVVIFSGGEAKGTDEVLAEVKEIAKGGAFGSIMGRNAFQRPKQDALKLLADVMQIYKDIG